MFWVFSDYNGSENGPTTLQVVLKLKYNFTLTGCPQKYYCSASSQTLLWSTGRNISLLGGGWVWALQKNKSLSFSLRMIGSLRCNFRDNREQAECIMHCNHRQEEGRVKRGQANVVICFVQSLQLGIFYMMQLKGEGSLGG